jgi:hypothetical protein
MMNSDLSLRAKATLELRKRQANKKRLHITDLLILNKQQQGVPLTLNRVQQHLRDNMTGRDLILKSRQQGVSTFIQGLLLEKAANETARVGTLAHDDETTQKLRDMQQFYYANLPDGLRPERAINNATRTYFPETQSMMYIGTAGNTERGRGGTYSHVHGSEVAFWKNAQKVMSGLLQGVPEDGAIMLESTPNGMSGWFYEQCMASLDGDSIWTLHFFPWWWDSGYQLPLSKGEVIEYTDEEAALVKQHRLTPQQIKWRRRKIKELPHEFKQEYPEDVHSCFLASGTSYFGDVSDVFTASAEAQPIAGHRYVMGVDFAQTTDYTVGIVIDETANAQVDCLRINKQPWQEMRRQIAVMAAKWDAKVLGEANAMGSTNIELLHAGEGGLYPPVKLTAFQTTAQTKPPLIQALHHALHESGLLLIDDSAMRHELQAFISRQTPNGGWAYEAGEGAHDDMVIALALAWWAIVGVQVMRQGVLPKAMADYRG